MDEKVDDPFLDSKTSQKSEGTSKKKITIVVDEDDPCLKREDKILEEEIYDFRYNPGNDPRYVNLYIYIYIHNYTRYIKN